MKYIIGIDIGTSGTKTVLADQNGMEKASYTAEYPLYQPKNGYAEQNPEDWFNASAQGILQCLKQSGIDGSSVCGIGLSGQMHGLVLLDENDEVIRPAIIWCDQRTGEQCEKMTQDLGRKKLMEITANPALTGFTASKLLWVRQHEPENFRRIKKILLPKDYVRFRLTGEYATEVSDASGMQLLNVPERRWSKTMLDYCGIDESMLGKVYESCEITGTVTQKASGICGLPEGVPVVGGAGDQAASAVGNAIVREGAASVTIGTSGVVFVHSDSVKIDPSGRVHTLCHAVPGAWHIMGVTQGAGLSFKWMRDNFFKDIVNAYGETGMNANAALDKIAAESPCGSDGIIYLPYLMGERTPHLDPDCRGVFFGLSAVHTRGDMLRSVLEGVVYSLNDCLNVIREMGIKPEKIFTAGGGGQSSLWRQITADVFGREVSVNSVSESGALGVIILAGVGAGLYKDVQSACDMLVSEKLTAEPDMKNNEKYEKYYSLYRRLYASLKDDFKELAEITR